MGCEVGNHKCGGERGEYVYWSSILPCSNQSSIIEHTLVKGHSYLIQFNHVSHCLMMGCETGNHKCGGESGDYEKLIIIALSVSRMYMHVVKPYGCGVTKNGLFRSDSIVSMHNIMGK